MPRRQLAFVFALIVGAIVPVAGQHYLLSNESHAFLELADPVVLHSGTGTMDQSYSIEVPMPIYGFRTPISTESSNTVIVEPGFGAIRAVSPLSDTMFSADGFVSNGLFPSSENSRLSYMMEGAGPTAQLTIEWRNFSITGGNVNTDTVSFQIRLSATGLVEFLYGRIAIASTPADLFIGGSPGPSVGAFMSDESFSTVMHTYFLTGSPSSPFPDTVNLFSPLNGIPESGTVYRLTPAGSVSVDETDHRITVAPNPADEYVTIRAKSGQHISQITVTDVLGSHVNIPTTSMVGETTSVFLDLSHLSPGLIIVTCLVDTEPVMTKVLVR